MKNDDGFEDVLETISAVVCTAPLICEICSRTSEARAYSVPRYYTESQSEWHIDSTGPPCYT